MLSINTNLISLFAQRSQSAGAEGLNQAVERLSSGVRINRAKDDVAGLGISEELRRQIGALNVAQRNAADAVSMMQTAESSLSSVSDLLKRIKELTVQGANQSLSREQRQYVASEMAQLRDEINSIASRTTFNGVSLHTGDFREAQKGRFDLATALSPSVKASLESSTIEEGDSSANIAGKSIVKFGSVKVDSADNGTYELTNNGAVLTLTKTSSAGVITRQSLTLTTDTATSRAQVQLSGATGGVTTLNFNQMGVELAVVNTFVGSDHTAAEIATKIVSIGTVENSAIKNAGWAAVSGANWAAGSGTLKAVISSSGGQIRTTSTTNLTAVAGYAAIGTSSLSSSSGRYEMAFTGTAANLNAALATLQVNNTTGLGDIVVEIVPSDISVFTNPDTGITSYYYVETTNAAWSTARTAALAMVKADLGLPADYDNGYLANVTSAAENAFLTEKLNADSWMGASDERNLITAAIAARNADIAAGRITGEVTNPTTYADQTAVEGYWYWIDGPERGLMFYNDRTGLNVSGGTGQVTAANAWSNWAVGEPNDSGGTEHYAQFYSSNKDVGPPPQSNWNDLPNGSSLDYIVEFGGYKGVFGSTSKTILLGKAGTISVGDALQMTSVTTSTADIGIYRLSTSEAAKTFTLKRFEVDGETLLQSETLDVSAQPTLGVGQSKTFQFSSLGVGITLKNNADYRVTVGSAVSGLDKEYAIATSQMASLIGGDGPVFQLGEASRNEISVDLFRDLRLGKNTDRLSAALFNDVDSLITSITSANDPSFQQFQTLENRIEQVIDDVASRRSAFGALQNRIQNAINNLGEQYVNLSAANSQILDTDFAWETARLTRLQIGQQASTAMLAQANQLPNVILALLQ
jgi:flagellin-like hook-associated protein FlgL